MKALIRSVHDLFGEGFYKIPGRKIAIRQIADYAVLRKKARHDRIGGILIVPVHSGAVYAFNATMIAPAISGNRPFSWQIMLPWSAEIKLPGVVVQADSDIHRLFYDIEKVGMTPVYILCIHESSPV